MDQAFAAATVRTSAWVGVRRRSRSTCAHGLVDELHVAIVPVFLDGGERLFDSLGDLADGYECAALVSGESVVHARVVRAAPADQAA